ncbi:MAG: DNA-binding protein [Deltaproteobacteria bacterium]|nr:DNA-binding protein [Deltaproteobacteria bacterium]
MTPHRQVTSKEIFMGKLPFGSDLTEGLTNVCTERNITLGRIKAIGAVQSAKIGFYNQKSREYEFISFDQPMEITDLTGNVSLRDGKTFVHAHVTLADNAGKTFGGHLAPGTVVFACEFVIEAFAGPQFERTYDEETGLTLWSLE